MSTSSNVPQLSINETGISAPTTEEILTGVLNDYNQAFGGNLNITTVATPQYVLASEEAQAIALTNAAIAYTLSQFDPSTAEGRFQDALGRIYFITRKTGTPTVVSATCTGQPGAVLPAGSRARSTTGDIYESQGDATFNENGSATVTFANVEKGAIECAPGTLIYIDQAVLGWDAVYNETAGITGTDIENRAAFEQRRYATTTLNAKSTTQAIYSNLAQLDGVLNVYVCENDTNATKTEGATDYPLAPHSIYCAVVGGADKDIAKTIWDKKPAGISTNGNTTVTVYDDTYLSNPPNYEIRFNRPESVPILFAVTITDNVMLPSNVIELVQQAIINTYNETVENNGNLIGSTLFASRFVGAVTNIDQYINVVSLKIGTVAANQEMVTVGIDQVPVVSSSTIQVVIQ